MWIVNLILCVYFVCGFFPSKCTCFLAKCLCCATSNVPSNFNLNHTIICTKQRLETWTTMFYYNNNLSTSGTETIQSLNSIKKLYKRISNILKFRRTMNLFCIHIGILYLLISRVSMQHFMHHDAETRCILHVA